MNTEPHRLALPVGFQIEHFRIEAVLGKGGFGITYLALDLQLGKRVAIKELLPDTIATRVEGLTVVPHSVGVQEDWEWARERFLEEARTLATFSHPAIVGVHRLIEANGTVYMVMDYVEGESYEARLQRIGSEPNQASLMAVMGPILSGLEEVHAHGLLHRDIKPENILIDKRGQPVLIDFGSARESVGKTMTMTSIVTHGYSPIEQYQTKGRMGPWTDIYAIAAVMSRAIAGEKPPVASDRVLDDSYESLVIRVSKDFSHEFCFAVDQALNVRPEDRPQSILEWKQQLFVDPDSGTRWAEETTASQSNNLKAQCPHCAQRVEMDWSMQSSLVECPNCRETFRAGGDQGEKDPQPPESPTATSRKTNKLPVVATAVCAGLLLLGFAATLLRPSDPDTLREKGRKLLQGEDAAKDPTKAISLLEQAADKGDVEAQLLLGKTFSADNEGGPAQDLAVSFKWFSKAADQGNAAAQNEVGWMLDEGRGVERDDVRATALYKVASESGYPPARYNYALMLRNGEGVAKDETEAQRLLNELTEDEKQQVFAWYKALSERGDPRAQGHLAGMYEAGFGHPKDDMLAAEWQRQSSTGLLTLAEAGDVEAMISTAWNYLDGDGLPKDESLGASWFRKAAEKGDVAGSHLYGTLLLDGRGVQKNPDEAAKWFRKAADKGDPLAQVALGHAYKTGNGVRKDPKEAAALYRKAADQGDPLGQYALAYVLWMGEGVAKDPEEAAQWLRKSADQGNALAQFDLGRLYYYGNGVPKNMEQGLALFRKAADQGVTGAQVELGAAHWTGEGETKDRSKAVTWFLQAAENGDSSGQLWLGSAYISGEGVEKDVEKGFDWIQKSAEQGNPEAQFMVGRAFSTGEGLPKDPNKAVVWFNRSAENGYPEAQLWLGSAYYSGEGVAKNSKKGAEWVEKAAEQGNASAQSFIGVAYYEGDGVTKNPRAAFKWWTQAAEQGNADGQTFLGMLYYNGEGVAKDPQKGAMWLEKGAGQGNILAQRTLGLAYAEGNGVTKSKPDAIRWLEKAASQGDAEAKEFLARLNEQPETSNSTAGLAAINQKLDRTIIPRISLTDATVRETVEFLERQSAINDPNPGLGGGKGIKIALTLDSHSASQTLTMDLANIPLREALDYVTRLADLKVSVNAGGVSISPLRATKPAATSGRVEYAIPVQGKPGFVTSPYAPNEGFIDVRGFNPGTEVRDPYTGRPFLVP
jgi:TPR repeat protein/serine/threonine protein kinase